jgi:hypothetical protein
MVEHEGILSLPEILIHLGKSMITNSFIGDFPIRFNEILGQINIPLYGNA